MITKLIAFSAFFYVSSVSANALMHCYGKTFTYLARFSSHEVSMTGCSSDIDNCGSVVRLARVARTQNSQTFVGKNRNLQELTFVIFAARTGNRVAYRGDLLINGEVLDKNMKCNYVR